MPLAVREARTELCSEDSNPDKIADACNWSRSFSNKELRKTQEYDPDSEHLLLWTTGTSPGEIELSL